MRDVRHSDRRPQGAPKPSALTARPFRFTDRGMPDNTRPPRHLVDPDTQPSLLCQAVMHAVGDVAKAKGLEGARVLFKRNARGENVVAVIWPA